MRVNTHPFFDSKKVLTEVFGYSDFKPMQLEIIQAILANEHVFVQLITGAGKSICYQIPAILTDGVSIVISPLMALMHDQVNALSLNNISACYLDSSLTYAEQQLIYKKLLENGIRLLYISPERFKNKEFINILYQITIDRFIIDEAHCISQWGHDFRKDYLNLTQLQYTFPNISRVALTATADHQTKNDIIHLLGLHPVQIFENYSNRDNLQTYFVQKHQAKKQLLHFLKQRTKDECGLVYCISRNQVEYIADFLHSEGYKTYIYHAGLETFIRESNQHLFNQSEVGVMVATIAFGLGINKSNIRYVAHLNLPQSIEHYIQESGRAGRDHLPAVSWVCYGLNDFILHNERIKNSDQSDVHKNIKLEKLIKMLEFCDSGQCKKCFLENYFNTNLCHHKCDHLNKHPLVDISLEAKQILLIMFYTNQQASITETIQILQGKNEILIQKYNLYNTQIFGVAINKKTDFWRSIIRHMISARLLSITNYDQILRFTPDSVVFIKEKNNLIIQKKLPIKNYHFIYLVKTEREKKLSYALRELRSIKAQEKKVSHEQIFDNFTLNEIIRIKPDTVDKLCQISGLNQYKIQWIGAEIINISNCTMGNKK